MRQSLPEAPASRGPATKSPTWRPTGIRRTCPFCGHHTLIAKGQHLMCLSCLQDIWRSAS